jgi:cell shape-determining protein MreC
MVKELKNLIFIIIIILFIIFTLRFYFSDTNKKNSYRSLNNIDEKISLYSKSLPFLKNNTKDTVKYLSKTKNTKKKKYSFWNLLITDE